jgi:hypothetical protein
MSPDDMSLNDMFIIAPPAEKASAKGNIDDHYSMTIILQYACANKSYPFDSVYFSVNHDGNT